MSIKYTAIPVLSPVQFYKEGKSQPARYHQKIMGDGWKYTDTLGQHENKLDYAQPWQFNDLISIQVRSHIGAVNNNSVVMDILQPDGQVLVADIAQVFYDQLPGDIVNGLQVWVWQFKLKYSTYSAQLPQAGANYIRFRLRLIEDGGPMEDSNTEVWLSELQEFRAEQENTHLIEYSNKHNKLETVFNQIDPLFQIRVNSFIHDSTPAFRYEQYESDDTELNQIDDDPVELFKYSFRDAPDYLVKKLNYILCCDRVRIDGNLFVKDEGAGWELISSQNHPIKGGTIGLRRAESYHADKNFENSFALWPQGVSTYPKYLYDVVMFDGVKAMRLKELVIEDATGGAVLAAMLNGATVSTNHGTTGTFSYTDHALVYAQGTGETWVATSSYIYTSYLALDVTVNIAGGILGWKDKEFRYGIDWGDTTVQNKELGNPFNPAVEIIQHQYAATGNYTVRLFHAGATAYSSFNYPSDSNHVTHCRIAGIAGILPSKTSQFFINGYTGVAADLSGMSATDFNFLRTARQTIENLILYDAMITVDIAQIFAGGSKTVSTFPKLNFVTLTNNQLTAIEAGRVVTEFVANNGANIMASISSGIIRIKQKPSAVIVDTNTLATIAAITGFPPGWTVEKD